MRNAVKAAVLLLGLGTFVAACGPTQEANAPRPPLAKIVTPRRIAHVVSAPAFPTDQKGINIEVWGKPSASDISRVLRDVVGMNLRVVALVIPFSQSNWRATNVGPVSFTPPPSVVNDIIQQAYRDHLAVMLRPILDEGTLTPAGYWRGDIEPTSFAAWFKNYGVAIAPYVALAHQDHVGAFDIGTELTSLEGDSTGWRAVIAEVRLHYHGAILYSFNWNSPSVTTLPSWTRDLTWIGLDAYYPLNTSSDTVSALTKAWQPWVAQGDKISHLVITEAGVMPKPQAWQSPWVWDPPGPTNWSVQAQYYTATKDAWQGHALGIYWWGIMLPRSSHGHATYDPIGHIGAAAIREEPRPIS